MKARDAGQPDPVPVNPEVTGAPAVERGHPDVIESAPDGLLRPPWRIAMGIALVLIVVAGLTGYLIGSRHRGATATPAAPPAEAAPAGVQPIAATSRRCSAQLKDRLQLGIEIVNQSATAMTLRQVQAVLPLQGLRPVATTWGSCGQLSPTAGGDDYPLSAGATTWLTVTFDVLAPCPGPLPVSFTVQYTQAGNSDIADLPGFADLGDVPYTSAKCPTGSS